MGQNAEQGIRRQSQPVLQQEQCHRNGRTGCQHTEQDIHIQNNREGNTEQGGMGHRIAEIGHAPPDYETTHGSGNHGNSQSGQQGTQDKIVHMANPSYPLLLAALPTAPPVCL